MADQLVKLISQQARRCEEYDNANRIIAQDALLIRSGAPFALTDNPRIREAAFHEAQWGAEARKGMPLATVPSPRRLGTPTIKRG